MRIFVYTNFQRINFTFMLSTYSSYQLYFHPINTQLTTYVRHTYKRSYKRNHWTGSILVYCIMVYCIYAG
jgi:hypothetical protein